MILIDNNFRSKYRSLIKHVRTEKIRVVKLEPGVFYVARKSKGHGQYIVTVKETKTGIFATCRRLYGGPCAAFGCCTHICAAVLRMFADGRREQRKESRAA